MIEDYLSEPSKRRSVENSDHSAEDGGGHRFVFYGSHGAREKKDKSKGKPHFDGPVKLQLSEETLASDIMIMHSDKLVIKKVEEFTDKIKECETEGNIQTDDEIKRKMGDE